MESIQQEQYVDSPWMNCLAVETISAGTEEAAAGCEETASTSQSLAQMALDLNKAISSFKL